VHLRICSPPIKWPCFYGIDMATREELIASSHTVEQICEHVGADSLGYLSTKGLARALGVSAKHFCWACLTGEYPITVPRELREHKLNLPCGSLEDDDARPLGEPVRMVLAGMFDDEIDEPDLSYE